MTESVFVNSSLTTIQHYSSRILAVSKTSEAVVEGDSWVMQAVLLRTELVVATMATRDARTVSLPL